MNATTQTQTQTSLPPTLIGALYEPMSRDTAEMFMQLCMANSAKTEKAKETFSEFQARELGGLGQILHARLRYTEKFNPKEQILLDTGLAIFLCVLSKGNPGNIVMWAWTMRAIYLKRGPRQLTVTDLAEEFPFGFPTEDGRSACWAAQKDESGKNRLDDPLIWKF